MKTVNSRLSFSHTWVRHNMAHTFEPRHHPSHCDHYYLPDRMNRTVSSFRITIRFCARLTICMVLLSGAAISKAHAQDAEEALVGQAYPTWRSVVKSQQFSDWLIAQPSERQALAKSPAAVDAIRLLDDFQRYRLATSAPGIIRLLCHHEVPSGRPNAWKSDEVSWVDTVTSKVDGYPAQITSSSIEYTAPTKIPQRVYINRVTGFIRTSDAQFPVLTQGTCTIAGTPKF